MYIIIIIIKTKCDKNNRDGTLKYSYDYNPTFATEFSALNNRNDVR